jgi:ferredoxin
VYGPDDRGHCEILVDDVPPELEEQARAGEANCPERAISITD